MSASDDWRKREPIRVGPPHYDSMKKLKSWKREATASGSEERIRAAARELCGNDHCIVGQSTPNPHCPTCAGCEAIIRREVEHARREARRELLDDLANVSDGFVDGDEWIAAKRREFGLEEK